MAVTSTAETEKPAERKFWITDAALANARERANLPTMETEVLANYLDTLVDKAIAKNNVEELRDGREEARLVKIIDGAEPIFALVKRSNTTNSAPFAVVTIMTSTQVERKRNGGTWKFAGFTVNPMISAANMQKLLSVVPTAAKVGPVASPTKPLEASSAPVPMKGGSYLVMYRTRTDTSPQYFWAEKDSVEEQLSALSPCAIPGSIEVYKKMELALRVLDPVAK